MYVRNSFLRVSDTRQYEPVNWVDSRFERARKLQELQQGESFLEYLIELQTEYGISNFF